MAANDKREAQALGLIGLGTMGANFARNLARNGVRLALFDTDAVRATALAAEFGTAATAADSLAALARALPRPRTIFMLVPAGAAVDEATAALAPHLEPGDCIIDGGNSFWRDTERRSAEMAKRGLVFLGFGVSGGAEGALNGPAIMAGGDGATLARIAPIFEAVAAAHDGATCFTRCGPGGAGHFVKMVHNGIEYAVMQLLAEAHVLLRDLGRVDAGHIRGLFDGWRGTMAESFLLDCARRVLMAREGGRPLVDLIVDAAEQKGTGTWTASAALELGVPAPTLAEAVFARGISSQRATRQSLADRAARREPVDAAELAADLRAAIPAVSLVAHVQGLALIAAASAAHGWSIDLAAVARGWRAGCILRSALMERLARDLAVNADPMQLLREGVVADGIDAWRRLVATAAVAGIAVPVLGSALSYRDGFRAARSGADLIQGMRDVFGRHGFRRTDKPGSFNADWPEA